MYKIIFTILLALSFNSYAQIYQWQDDQGNMHFSDQPHEGADKVKLEPIQVIKLPPPPNLTQPIQPQPTQEIRSYESVQILDPADELTIRNNYGTVDIAVGIDPPLAKGDQIIALVDGQPYGRPHVSPNFSIHDVDRGAHILAIQIVDPKKRVVGESRSVAFFMHQFRVNMTKQPKPSK